MPEDGICPISHDELLSYEEILRIVRAASALGIRTVRITGGEPLVRRGAVHLISEIGGISGIETVGITTNGVLLKDMLPELIEAGVKRVNISLDSVDRLRYERITGTDSLLKVMEGIDAALSVPGLKVKINAVALPDLDKKEVCSIASLARENDMDVRFIELMPIGLSKGSIGLSESEIMKALKEEFGEEEILSDAREGSGPARYVTFQGFHGKIGFISALSNSFCMDCNRIRLTSDGKLKTCLQFDSDLDLRALLRSGACDEAIKTAIETAILKKPARHSFNEIRDEENIEKLPMSQIGG